MQLKIDESFAEKVIPANDSVRLLDKIVESRCGTLSRWVDMPKEVTVSGI